MKTILVTGGSGLVGKALQQIQSNYSYNFIFLDSKKCNLLDFECTSKLFKLIKPEYVIHLAACVGGLYKNMNQPVKMLEENVLININVLKSSYQAGVKNVIACLSTCVFPDNIHAFINENMLNDGPPHQSNAAYAYAKRLLDIHCQSYNKLGCNYFCIIPTNIYGANDNYNLEDSHVIPGLIHRCYLSKLKNEPFVVRGTGKPLRQFIYNIDLAKLIMNLVISKFKENIILSPSTEHSISDVANIIAKKMDQNDIVYDHSFSDGQFRKTADTTKLTSNWPDFTFTPLEQGIADTIDHFIANYSSIRK